MPLDISLLISDLRSGYLANRFTPAETMGRLMDRADRAAERALWLAAQGIEPERPPYTVREGGTRICFVRDPDGYRIELVERPDL